MVRAQITNITDEAIAILDFTIKQVMRLGIKAVSMDDISSALGISKKTLYSQFESKSQLIGQAMSRHIRMEEQVMEDITNRAVDAIDEMAQIAEHTVIHFRQISPVLIHDLQRHYPSIWQNVVSHHSKFIEEKMSDNMKRGIQENYYREDIDVDIITKLYIGKSFSLVDEELFSPRSHNRETLIRQHLLYHLHGILSEEGRKHLQNFHALMT